MGHGKGEYAMGHGEVRANKSIPVIDVDGTPENADWIKHAGYRRCRAMSKQTLIGRIVQVAVQIGADRHPVALKDLRDAYLRTFPDALTGQTQESFNATLH